MSIFCKAHAKINLTLDVFDRRSGGYHDIAGIFQTISLSDDISVDIIDEPGVEIFVTGPESVGVPDGIGNLAARAAAELLATVAPESGAQISLVKRIPAQSGLGGGSSDAAAVLRAVAGALGIPIDSEIVTQIAGRLGSDVPFFLSGGTARVTGLGEIVEPLEPVQPMSLVIARPRVGVSTAHAYALLDGVPDRQFGRFTERWPSGGAGNDFEPVVYAAYPDVAHARDILWAAGCKSVTLCGSGSAVFGVAANAEDIAEKLRNEGVPQVWSATTVSAIDR